MAASAAGVQRDLEQRARSVRTLRGVVPPDTPPTLGSFRWAPSPANAPAGCRGDSGPNSQVVVMFVGYTMLIT